MTFCKKEIYVKERNKKIKYFFHETYTDYQEAIIIGKYYKKEEGSKYFILIDQFSSKTDKYHLYLDNVWGALIL